MLCREHFSGVVHMPMDGFTLGLIAQELNSAMQGARIDKITQPEADEILLAMRCPGVSRVLLLSANASAARAQFTAVKRANPLEPPAFCMLLRKRAAGCRVKRVAQYMGDRILDFVFEGTDELGDPCELTITCECMGRHSNLILYDQTGRILESARRVPADVSSVRQVLPGLRYERPPMQDKLQRDGIDASVLAARLSGTDGPLRKVFAKHIMGLSEQTAEELAMYAAGDGDALVDRASLDRVCSRAAEWFRTAQERVDPVVYYDEAGTPADICAFPYATRSHFRMKHFPTISEAMDEYYSVRDDIQRVFQKATALRHTLKRNIERCEKKLAIRMQTLKDAEHMEEYRIKGELLNASIAQIPRGAKTVFLPNWYDEKCAPLEIALDESLSPARNAQRYFKQYQKARNAASLAQKQADETREELAYLEGQLENLEKSADEADLQEIRAELEKLGYVSASRTRRQMKALPQSRPMRFISGTGREILVGKNNMQNERLTFSAAPDDLWLHAKDMPGSHVILRGPEPDETSIREAAMLAALYSKGASSSNVPVDMTLRRYVKKPSGAKPGYVIFTHQTTVYVTPDADKARAMAAAPEAQDPRA